MEFNLPARNTTHSVAGEPIKKNAAILALGAESAGNFSVYQNGVVYFSQNFGDVLEEVNFNKYKRELNNFLKNKKIKPDIILTDLHPDFLTTHLGKELAKKYHAKHIQVQHHLAHIFSAIGDQILHSSCFLLPSSFFGVALDGTGYGTDGKIWGGEAFAISNFQFPISNQFSISKFQISKQKLQIQRIGHLENQIMIGGELAIKEPARMLLAILAKIKMQKSKCKMTIQNEKLEKDFIYKFVKKYYSHNQFELLYNQLQQNFNCVETSSAGRILDAVSLLLGFCGNKRSYKHEPAFLLEANSTKPYTDLKPKIDIYNKEERSMKYELSATFLFEYLIKNLRKDKKRLAATAQLYIARGLYEIIKKQEARSKKQGFFIAGGISNNKIILNYLKSKNFYANKKVPRGDAGISFGQIIYFLLNN